VRRRLQPAIQQVVRQLFDELPLVPNREAHLQEQGARRLFRGIDGFFITL
jgi:hypothetical protein